MQEQLQKIVSDFWPSSRVVISPQFAASNKQNRLMLSQVIAAQKIPERACSISHCPNLGGFFYLANSAVGFDIELRERITPAIIERVSAPQELLVTDRLGHLWVAKEASFKALRDRQPATISSVRIKSWQIFRSAEEGKTLAEIWQFVAEAALSPAQQGFKPISGRGLTLSLGPWDFGFFVHPFEVQLDSADRHLSQGES